MRTTAPKLLPVLRSRGLAALLVQLFVVEDDYASASALAQRSGLSISTVHRELDRLAAAGLVESHRAGNVRMTKASDSAPYFEELRTLLLKALGPAVVLAEELRGVAGVEKAFIHGSWAARYHDEPGPPPRDIDVIVIGRPAAREVDQAAAQAERRLGREVTPTIIDPVSWQQSESGFVRTVRARPLVEIELCDAER
jgi:DNA-binding transcriptional ArsR family regulator